MECVSLEPHRRGGSNEYPQSVFRWKLSKKYNNLNRLAMVILLLTLSATVSLVAAYEKA